MVYKIDGTSAGNGSTPLVLQQVGHDGATKIGPYSVLYNHGPNDNGNVEAPVIHLANDVYFLFFSSGDTFTTTYTISYLTSVSGVGGPYGNRQTLMQTGPSYCGQTFVSPGGADLKAIGGDFVFHQGQGGQGPRQLNTGTLSFSGRTASIVC